MPRADNIRPYKHLLKLLFAVGEKAGVGVGQEAGGYEGIHVAGVGTELQIGHIGRHLVAFCGGLLAHYIA